MPPRVRPLFELANSHNDLFQSYRPPLLSQFLRLLDRIETAASADDVNEPEVMELLNEFRAVLVSASLLIRSRKRKSDSLIQIAWCALHDGQPLPLRADLRRVSAVFARLPNGAALEAEFDDAVMDVLDPIREQFLVATRAYVEYQKMVVNAVNAHLADPVLEIANSARLHTLELEVALLEAEVTRREQRAREQGTFAQEDGSAGPDPG